MTTTAADRAVTASRSCMAVLLETADPDIGISDICDQTGLSIRTFHRYFTTRAKMIRPALTDMTRRFDDSVAAAHGALSTRVVNAFTAEVVNPAGVNVISLVGILRQRHDLWASYLEAIEFGETHLTDVLRSIDASLDFWEARVASAAIVTSSRLALEGASDGDEAVQIFSDCIRLFGIGTSARRRQ